MLFSFILFCRYSEYASVDVCLKTVQWPRRSFRSTGGWHSHLAVSSHFDSKFFMEGIVVFCFVLFCFFYFWLCWVFIAACRLSLVAARRLSLVAVSRGFSC